MTPIMRDFPTYYQSLDHTQHQLVNKVLVSLGPKVVHEYNCHRVHLPHLCNVCRSKTIHANVVRSISNEKQTRLCVLICCH